jgi:BirA family biotin operon repressor/biotin-[acetyl-CoA-carboxylase] ligase
VHAVGVDDEGRLVVRGGDSEYAVAAGDVVHVRPAE